MEKSTTVDLIGDESDYLSILLEGKPLHYTDLAKVCGGYTTTPEGVSELTSENYKDVLERIQKI